MHTKGLGRVVREWGSIWTTKSQKAYESLQRFRITDGVEPESTYDIVLVYAYAKSEEYNVRLGEARDKEFPFAYILGAVYPSEVNRI